MKLFCIITEMATCPEVIMDDEGRPTGVFKKEINATKKCDDLNKKTNGGYYVEEFETED